VAGTAGLSETGTGQQRPRLVVTRRLPSTIEERMATLFDVDFNAADTPYDAETIAGKAEGADVLVTTITDRIDPELIGRLPAGLRLIAQFGNGVDNIDLSAAHAAGITVTNTPSVLTEDTADMAMALILSVPRRLGEGAQIIADSGTWPGWSPTWMLGRRISAKSLGIVGLGRIGAAVARRAAAFGLNIHYFSRSRKAADLENQLNATYWPSLDEMLSAVDIVSLHVPYTNETFNLLDRERLGRMKRDAFLVNVSRPELIDEDALIGLIEEGHLSGAGLDVVDHRQGIDPRLVQLAKDNRIVLTPHMASATLEGRIEMGETVIVNIRVFMDGESPPHRVLPDTRIEAPPK